MYRATIVFSAGVLAAAFSAGTAWASGAVYAMTNTLGNNQVLVYSRSSSGTLSTTPVQTIATQGGGSGLQLSSVDNLGSAGSVQLDPSNQFLFVVNTESANTNNGMGNYNSDCNQGTITSFRVGPTGMLTLVDRVFSGGLFPNSLTVRQTTMFNGLTTVTGDLLYVLNAGGPGNCGVSPNVTGFIVDNEGRMEPVFSTQSIAPGPATGGTGVNCPAVGLSPAADFQCGLNPPSFVRSPAQVKFTPDGSQVVVTVKGTNSIYVFPVQLGGTLGNPIITQAPGPALPSYFGFTFDLNSHMLVVEAFGAATAVPTGAAGAVSSFYVQAPGSLSQVSADVGDNGTAACWILLDRLTGKYAYVSNNLSNTISSYAVNPDGSVKLLFGNIALANGPNDLAGAIDTGASYLYVVNAGSGTVAAYQINGDGSLTSLGSSTGLPVNASAQGIAAY
jgi:6-phosphogluconolactonase (cycloisomerase 2 family)